MITITSLTCCGTPSAELESKGLAGCGAANHRASRSPLMQMTTLARAAARVVVALVSAGALVASGVAWTLQQHVSATVVPRAALPPPPVLIGQAFTALLVGLDARTDANG